MEQSLYSINVYGSHWLIKSGQAYIWAGRYWVGEPAGRMLQEEGWSLRTHEESPAGAEEASHAGGQVKP